LLEEDLGKMILCQHGRSDGASAVEVLDDTVGIGMLNGILEIDVGFQLGDGGEW
jgi:hypothetical protein